MYSSVISGRSEKTEDIQKKYFKKHTKKQQLQGELLPFSYFKRVIYFVLKCRYIARSDD